MHGQQPGNQGLVRGIPHHEGVHPDPQAVHGRQEAVHIVVVRGNGRHERVGVDQGVPEQLEEVHLQV